MHISVCGIILIAKDPEQIDGHGGTHLLIPAFRMKRQENLMSLRPAGLRSQFQNSQPGLHKETLSPKTKQNKKLKRTQIQMSIIYEWINLMILVAHNFNAITVEAEARRSLHVQGQHGLHNKL